MAEKGIEAWIPGAGIPRRPEGVLAALVFYLLLLAVSQYLLQLVLQQYLEHLRAQL